MASLKPVEPEIIGRVRGAQRTTRFVPTDDGGALRDAARGVEKFGRMAAQAIDAFAALNKKREDSEFSQALLDAEEEADRRYQDEVLSQTGTSAAGAYGRQQTIYREVLDKYLPNVPQRRRTEFSQKWQQRSNSYGRNSMAFEAQQLDASYVQTETARYQREFANTVSAGGDVLTASVHWREAKQAFSNAYARKNGGIVDRDSLAKAEVLYGEGVLLVPARRRRDGSTEEEQRLRIVEKNPSPGEITKKEAERIIRGLRERSDAYEAAWGAQSDSMVSQTVGGFIKQKDIKGASEYLEEASRQGWVSGEVKTLLGVKVQELAEVYSVSDTAGVFVGHVVDSVSPLDVNPHWGANGTLQFSSGKPVAADADSRKYGGPDQDKRFSEALQNVRDAYKDDPRKAELITDAMRHRYTEVRQMQKAAFKADAARYFQGLIRTGKPYSALLTDIESDVNTSSRVRSEVKKMVVQRRDADEAEKSRSPLYLAEQERKLARFAYDLSQGRGELVVEGRVQSFDFSKPEDLQVYVGLVGFSSKNAKRAAELLANSNNNVDASEVAAVLGELLDMPPVDALDRFPQAVALLNTIKGTSPKTVDRKWIKEQLVPILEVEASNFNFLVNTTSSFGEYLTKKRLDKREIHFTPAQLDSLGDVISKQRRLYSSPLDVPSMQSRGGISKSAADFWASQVGFIPEGRQGTVYLHREDDKE